MQVKLLIQFITPPILYLVSVNATWNIMMYRPQHNSNHIEDMHHYSVMILTWVFRCRWCCCFTPAYFCTLYSFHIYTCRVCLTFCSSSSFFIYKNILSLFTYAHTQIHKYTRTHTALGCIVPTAPKNGQLVLQTDDTLKFQCDPSYVFPDTISGSRTLYCTDRNTWDISLPDCVGMFSD